MSKPEQLYEKIVQLTGIWRKGGSHLPPPLLTLLSAASTRDDLSRVGPSSLREIRKLDGGRDSALSGVQ